MKEKPKLGLSTSFHNVFLPGSRASIIDTLESRGKDITQAEMAAQVLEKLAGNVRETFTVIRGHDLHEPDPDYIKENSRKQDMAADRMIY